MRRIPPWAMMSGQDRRAFFAPTRTGGPGSAPPLTSFEPPDHTGGTLGSFPPLNASYRRFAAFAQGLRAALEGLSAALGAFSDPASFEGPVRLCRQILATGYWSDSRSATLARCLPFAFVDAA